MRRFSKTKLPDEILLDIFTYLNSNKDLLSLSLVNKEFLHVVKRYKQKTLEERTLEVFNSKTEPLNFTFPLFNQPTNFPKLDTAELFSPNDRSFAKHLKEYVQEPGKVFIDILFAASETTDGVSFVLAGGSVVYLLSKFFKNKEERKKENVAKDIDVFIISNDTTLSKNTVLQVMKESQIQIRLLGYEIAYFVTEKFINIYFNNGSVGVDPPYIQIILSNFKNKSSVLYSFDLDITKFLYDGKKVFTTYEGLRSLSVKKNLLDPKFANSEVYSKRISKYESKGVNTVFKLPFLLENRLSKGCELFGLYDEDEDYNDDSKMKDEKIKEEKIKEENEEKEEEEPKKPKQQKEEEEEENEEEEEEENTTSLYFCPNYIQFIILSQFSQNPYIKKVQFDDSMFNNHYDSLFFLKSYNKFISYLTELDGRFSVTMDVFKIKIKIKIASIRSSYYLSLGLSKCDKCKKFFIVENGNTSCKDCDC